MKNQFTLKHVNEARSHEILIPGAYDVEAYRSKPYQGDFGHLTYSTDDEPGIATINDGSVYVTNQHGKTVAVYHFYDTSFPG